MTGAFCCFTWAFLLNPGQVYNAQGISRQTDKKCPLGFIVGIKREIPPYIGFFPNPKEFPPFNAQGVAQVGIIINGRIKGLLVLPDLR
jgi:hypothetical protein